MREDTPAADRPRFIVCGDNPMAFRLVDMLATQYDAEVTVILASVRDNWAPKITDVPGVRIVEAHRLDEDAFRRAGVDEADALGLLDQEDAGNVDAALIAQELNPRLRIVMRMSNQGLGERISQLLSDCVVLSAAAIAAPAFVAAALDESTSPPITVGGRTLVATRRDAAAPTDVMTSLATTTGRIEPELLPEPAGGDLVLALSRSDSGPIRPRRRHRTTMGLVSIVLGARLRLILGLALGIFAVATAALAWADHFASWRDAAYVAFLTELGGANIDPTASGLEQVTLIGLSVVSIALIPALTAAVVDSAVKTRLRREAGGLTGPLADHIVVVGLGHVGTRVVRSLHAAGIDVVAIERQAEVPGVKVARDLGVPVIIGDASQTEVLESAWIGHARALAVVSTDDVTNLEMSLLGRAAKPTLRVVVRLFDGEFADRVQRAFGINSSRSVSYLAAPAFAAAMVGRQIVATIPVGRRVLLVAEIPVGEGSALDGAIAGTVNAPHTARLVALTSPGSDQPQWRVPAGRQLNPDDRLLVVATRAGLSSLLTDAAPRLFDREESVWAPDPAEHSTAPEPRRAVTSAISTEQAATDRPVGPTDGGSTDPA